MSSKRRSRAQQKADTRAALFSAARAVFSESGYRDAQVGDISRAAGVAHGTFYVHFRDKAEVLDALLADFNAALVEKLQAAWSPRAAADPEALAKRLAAICLDHWASDRELVLAFAQRAGLDGSVASLRDGINPPVAAFLTERLRELAAVSGSPLEDAELVAQALLGLWTRIGLKYLFGEDLTRKRAVDTLARMSVGALAAMLPDLPSGVIQIGAKS